MARSSSAKTYGLAVVAATLAFLFSYCTRYVPATSYGELAVFVDPNRELLAYRDYFFQSPPGIPMITRALARISGGHIVVLPIFGALLRTLATLSLYGLLLRVTRPWCAALAAMAALVVSVGDIADIPSYYNHVAIGLTVCGTYLAVAANDRESDVRAVLGGALLAFAIACKQTMIFGALGAAVAVLTVTRPKRPARLVAMLVVGGLISVAIVFGWLASHGLVGACLQALRAAPEGKGGIGASLARPIALLDVLRAHRDVTLIAVGVLVLCLLLPRLRARASAVLGVLSIGVIAFTGSLLSNWNDRAISLFLTALGFWGCLVVAAVGRRERAWVGLGLLGFTAAYTCAVSWPLFENMAFPSVGIVAAFALEMTSRARRFDLRGAVTAAVIASAVLAAHRKYTAPYAWGPWVEPSLDVARPSKHAALAGMQTSPAAEKLYDAVVDVVRATTRPEDRIYVYPNMPILYGIAGRRPATFGFAHWVDICPDFLGVADAERLLRSPPKLMIIRRDPEKQVASDELFYRDGRASGVRTILRALEVLGPRYRVVGVYRADNVTSPIEFLERVQ